jgi:hypothetical protein
VHPQSTALNRLFVGLLIVAITRMASAQGPQTSPPVEPSSPTPPLETEADLWARGDNAWGARGTMRLDAAHAVPAGSIIVIAGGAASSASHVLAPGDSDTYTLGRLNVLWAPRRGLELGFGERVFVNSYQTFLPVRRQQVGNPSFDVKVSGAPVASLPEFGLGAALHGLVPTAVHDGGLVPRALTLGVAALGSWRFAPRAEATVNLGYRFDNSSALAAPAFLAKFSNHDARYALGISGIAHALTYGAGVLGEVPIADLIDLAPYAEVTGEFDAGMHVGDSPLRGTLGVKLRGARSGVFEVGLGADIRIAGAPRAGAVWAGVPPWLAFAQLGVHFFDHDAAATRTCQVDADCTSGEVCHGHVCTVVKTVIAVQTTFTVHGTVVDAITRHAVPDTKVVVSGYENSPLSVDPASGAFTSFPIPTDGGPIQITAAANRYQTVEVTLPRGGKGETVAVSLNLTRSEQPSFGTLRGSLADRRTGAPVRRGQVFIPGLNQKVTVHPNQGTFSAPVQAGRWDVLISAPGYVTQRQQVIISEETVIILDVALFPEPSRP